MYGKGFTVEEFPFTDEFLPESAYDVDGHKIYVARVGGGVVGQMYAGKWRFVIEDRDGHIMMRRELDSLVPISHIQLGCDIAARALQEFQMRMVRVSVEIMIPHEGKVVKRNFYYEHQQIPPNNTAVHDSAGMLMLSASDYISESIVG